METTAPLSISFLRIAIQFLPTGRIGNQPGKEDGAIGLVERAIHPLLSRPSLPAPAPDTVPREAADQQQFLPLESALNVWQPG